MLYFAIEMDENRLKENGYDVQEVYNCIADAYQGLQGKLAFIENNIRFYTRDKNDGNDFQRLWRVSLGLRKKDLELETYDFKENYVNIVTADEKEVAFQFGMNLIEEMKLIKDLNIILSIMKNI